MNDDKRASSERTIVAAVLEMLRRHGITPKLREVRTLDDLVELVAGHGIRHHHFRVLTFRELLALLELKGMRAYREIRELLWRILQELEPERFTIRITQTNTQENTMAGIAAGSTGTFTATLNDNGAPIALPAGSTFGWSADDASVTFVTSPDTTSTVVSVPAGDEGTSVTITASTTAPDSTTVSGSVTVPLTPEPQQFTVTVAQTA